MTVIRNRRPWFAWGLAALALGGVVPFTLIAVTGGGAGRGWDYWVSLAIGWACAIALLVRALRLAIVDLVAQPGRVEVTARYLHKTVREGFPPSRRHRLEHVTMPDMDGEPWHSAVLRTPGGSEYVFASGPMPERVAALVAQFAEATDRGGAQPMAGEASA